MRLLSFAFRGVRGLPQRDVDLSSAVSAGRPFLITGSAGSGKTTALEAIAAAKEAASPYGLVPKRARFREPARPDGRVVLRWRREAHDALTLDAGDDTVTTSWSLDEGAPSDLVMAPGLRAFLPENRRRSPPRRRTCSRSASAPASWPSGSLFAT